MPRAKNNVAARKRHKKVMKMAKGYRLSKSNLYRTQKIRSKKDCNMPIAIVARKNGVSAVCGLPVSTLHAV